jgi:hypothetical protein
MEVSITLTPEEVAMRFWEMDNHEQARFFNRLAEIGGYKTSFQLQYLTETDGLSLAGRRVMQEIGEYSHWGLTCRLEQETRHETVIC